MAYLTPKSNPSASVRRVLYVPDDAYWIAIVTGFLAYLCEERAWEQHPGKMEDVATTVARAKQMFEEWLAGEECPP